LAECGEFEEAVARGREAVEVAEGIDNPYSLVQACVGLGHLLSARGDFELAIRPLERAVAVARQWNLDLLAPQAMRYLGRAYAMSARVTEGLDLVREAARGVAARALLVQEAPVARVLGEVCLLADQPDEGSQTLARALSLARERGQRGDEAYALHLLATVSAARAEHDAAACDHSSPAAT